MKNGVVGRITDGIFRYQGWPTLAKDEKGVLYVASSGYRLGHICPFGKNLLYVSHDNGESWLGPIIANDDYMDDRDAALTAWGDGQLLLNWFAHPREFYQGRKNPSMASPLSQAILQKWDGLSDADHAYGSYIKLSQDGGKTWGDRIRVPLTAPHGPIRRKDGSFFLLGRGFYSSAPDCPDGVICAVESRDGGKTWQMLGVVAEPDGTDYSSMHEPHALELPDGTILGGIRVHEGDGFTIYLTRSFDGGKTWEMPKPTGICGTPPHFLLHSSGAVVMVYGRRENPCGQRAKISYDGGMTWSEEITVGAQSPDRDCGYPSSVELSDGSILTVYYQKYPGDTYNSILSTRWELPEKD